jgi:hypothetical protein
MSGFRSFAFVALFLVGLLAAAPTAFAQAGTRAYAPENLSSLSRQDQIRVISLEYSEQAKGRSIPDDQLRFYLDQVRSGWGFSRIKQDIAQSLRGGGHGHGPGAPGHGPRPPAPPAPVPVQVRCESRDNRPNQCQTNFRDAVMVQQLSKTTCIEGRNWGFQRGMIWVNGGCRAIFEEGRRGGHQAAYTVTCSSHDNRFQTCAWDARYGAPVLVERISSSACIEGRSWGYDKRNGLWVSNGCRARFGTRR